jgi:aspartate racemase
MPTKVLGLLGGMGPEATAHYYTQLVRRTAARVDQDHLHVVIEANPRIPDRTRGILGLGESPLPHLLQSVERLNRAGVDEAIITCFTSHYYFEQMQQHANFRLIHAIDALAHHLHRNQMFKVGLLATSGTLKTELFQTALKGIDVLVPKPEQQEQLVMRAIYDPSYGIKSGHRTGLALEHLTQAAEALLSQGADVILAGCTEIGMVFGDCDLNFTVIDPILLVIDALIQEHKEAV